MFAPDGFIPFSLVQGSLTERGRAFFRACAIPWMSERVSENEIVPSEVLRFAIAARIVYIYWLVDYCLWQQPVPVFIANPSGRVMRAAPHFFEAEDHLSFYEFFWPLEDDELRPLAEHMSTKEVYGAAEDALLKRFGYHFLSHASCCISSLDFDSAETLPPNVEALTPIISQFDGWSVCIRAEDFDAMLNAAFQEFSWSATQDAERPVGRPRKQEAAAQIYRGLYPKGHTAIGATWGEAARQVSEVGNDSISIYTLKRAISEQ